MIYVALLRGINVGGNHKVDMKALKASFESVGLQSVETYINSGNVVFESEIIEIADLQRLLEKVIERDFKLEIPVLVRNYENFETLIQALPNTWANDKQQKSDVLFLWDIVDEKTVLQDLSPKPNIDEARLVGRAVLWHVSRENQRQTALIKLVGTKLYKQLTIRNVNTVRKIYKIMQAKRV